MRRLAVLLLLACGRAPDPLPATPCEDAALTAALEVPVGGHAVLAPPAGSRVTDVEVTEAGGFTATRLDATRWDLKAPYSATDGTVKLWLHCSDAVGTAELHASTRAPHWSALSQWSDPTAGRPANREYGVMWLDEGRLLVYGGFHYRPKQFTASTDLWSFELESRAWTELTPSTAAPQFMGARVGRLPGSRQVLFVGGVDAMFQPVQHLDRFDPTTLAFSAQPSTGARAFGDYQPGFVFDSKRGRFLSVCGQSDTVHCRVSQLTVPRDGATAAWEELSVEGPAPEGRSGHFFAYDEATDRVIVFAGMSTRILGDTWALELSGSPKWVKLFDETDALKRRNGAFALDPVNHRLVVWGGTPDGLNASEGVLFFDLDRGHEVWMRLDPQGGAPARASGMAVYDAAKQRIIAGFGNTSAGDFADLWSLDL